MCVEPNQVIALIGPTGSGKTSLVNLIPRFYDLSQGAVLVDGVDVRQVDLVSLRRQIGIVLQTSLLFSATIAENIAYGRPEAGEEEIEAAAQAAQAHEFIIQLPDGYETVVGERGVTLSGGQRQRVAIARALLMDPRILILDDSTSSVDTETERLIQQALERLMEGRTTFVIAHRLSTVRRADLILVMEDGRIVERGTHQELLEQAGLYREIYELQLRRQEHGRSYARIRKGWFRSMAQIAPPFEEALVKGYDPKVVRRLVGYFRPYTPQLLVSLVLMLFNSAAAVAGPYLVEVAIDSGIDANNPAVLKQTVLLFLLAICVQWISIFLRINIMVRVGQSIIYDLRAQLFEHLQTLSLSFFSRFSVGRVITRVINDVGVLREFIAWALLAIARDLFTLIGILIVMLSLNLSLSLITFIVLPVMALITMLFRRRARDNYRKVRQAISWVNSVLAENINGVRVVQAFSRQAHNYDYFSGTVNRNNLDTNLRAARMAASFPAAIDFLGAIAVTLVVWLGGRQVLAGNDITPGVLVAFVLYIDRFFDPIRDLSQRYDSFQSTMAGGERIFALLDTPVEVQDAPDAIELPSIHGEVRFENVSFHYPDDPALVLEQIDLQVPAGAMVALVGKTGAGKSTLVKLVSRFHDPTEGRIPIDGYDLRRVTQTQPAQPDGHRAARSLPVFTARWQRTSALAAWRPAMRKSKPPPGRSAPMISSPGCAPATIPRSKKAGWCSRSASAS